MVGKPLLSISAHGEFDSLPNFVRARKTCRRQELSVKPLRGHLTAGEFDCLGTQVDGPHHFATNTRAPLGMTVVRDRLLRRYGWRVVSVPYHHWYSSAEFAGQVNPHSAPLNPPSAPLNPPWYSSAEFAGQ
eukprot:5665549-Pyramimonas_sp.AAC.1